MRTRIALPILIIGLLIGSFASAQVKIGDNPQTIDPASVLELESSDRVLVITRVDSLQMAAIVPSPGALVYNTSADCIFYYNGTAWINLCNGATGNSGDFTTEAIANVGGEPTIVITPTATGNNFEVAPNSITTDQITNGSIFAEDLNLGALDGATLVPNSITRDKFRENSIGPFAIDRDSLPLSFFQNDAGFITGANIVSGDADNAIVAGGDGGAFYDDAAVAANTAAIAAAVAADGDTDAANEIQVLGFEAATRTITLSRGGGSVPLPAAADELDGDPENELITDSELNGSILTITQGGNPFDIDLGGLGSGSATVINSTPSITVSGDGSTATPYELTAVGGGGGGGTVDQTAAEVPVTAEPDNYTATAQNVEAHLVGIDLALASGGGGGGADNQTAVEVPFAPYQSIDSTNVQAAVQELKDELDALELAGGGSNVNQVQIVNDSLVVQDAGGRPGFALIDISLSDLSAANDSISMASFRIKNIGTPLEDDDAATKQYVDDNASGIASLTSGSILLGDADDAPQETLISDISFSDLAAATDSISLATFRIKDLGVPIEDNDAATKQYVDNNASGIASLTNGSVLVGDADGAPEETLIADIPFSDLAAATDSISLATFRIKNLGTPLEDNDAATKQYVDDNAGEIASLASGNILLGDPDGAPQETLIANIPFSDFAAATDSISLATFRIKDLGVPLEASDAATKKYVDDNAGGIASLTSGSILLGDVDDEPQETLIANIPLSDFATATDSIFMATFRIKDLGVPLEASDAATKKYVDDNAVEFTGTTGSISFVDADGTLTENNAQFFWDNTNERLTVGNQFLNDVDQKLNVNGVMRTTGIKVSNGTKGVPAYRFTNNGDTGMFLADNDGVLAFSTVNEEALRIDESQNVGIGSNFINNIGAKLHVDGNIWADGEVRITGDFFDNDLTAVVPDYVFEKYFLGSSKLKEDYNFKSLNEIETFVKKHHHLPGIKSAAEVKKEGSWNLSASNIQNLEKIEELYLHTIEQEKKINQLQSEKESLSSEVKALRSDIDEIKAMLKKSE